jgi:hypothetical protein
MKMVSKRPLSTLSASRMFTNLFSTFHCRPDGRLSVELLACFAEEWQIMASQPGAFKVARLLLSCRFVVSHSMIP